MKNKSKRLYALILYFRPERPNELPSPGTNRYPCSRRRTGLSVLVESQGEYMLYDGGDQTNPAM